MIGLRAKRKSLYNTELYLSKGKRESDTLEFTTRQILNLQECKSYSWTIVSRKFYSNNNILHWSSSICFYSLHHATKEQPIHSPTVLNLPTHLLIHDLFNLQWFHDVRDELRMHVRITNLWMKEHAYSALGKTQPKKSVNCLSFGGWSKYPVQDIRGTYYLPKNPKNFGWKSKRPQFNLAEIEAKKFQVRWKALLQRFSFVCKMELNSFSTNKTSLPFSDKTWVSATWKNGNGTGCGSNLGVSSIPVHFLGTPVSPKGSWTESYQENQIYSLEIPGFTTRNRYLRLRANFLRLIADIHLGHFLYKQKNKTAFVNILHLGYLVTETSFPRVLFHFSQTKERHFSLISGKILIRFCTNY